MEAIRNYLDNMFANLPGTPSVLRAKEELWQMMEDKYTELIAEGKSENEAVGSVISEFGNLSELAEALGLEEEVKQQKEEEEVSPDRILTSDDAKEYIKMRRNQAVYLSLGLAIIILSVTCPIIISSLLPDRYDPLSAIGMFAITMVGVGFLIYGNSLKRRWKFLKEEKCTLSMEATKYVTEERERYEGSYVTELIAGVVCCAASWVPAAVFDEFTAYGDTLGGVFFFVLTAVGVFLLRHANINKHSYKRLLKLNKAGTMKANYKTDEPESAKEASGEYAEQTVKESKKAGKERKYINPVAEFFMDVYWPTVVCLYLCASFMTFRWDLTWIIWPVTGILHGVFSRNLTE